MSYIASDYGAEDTTAKVAVEKDRFGRELYEITCAICHQPSRVPFKPDPSRPAYCGRCHRGLRQKSA